jgi:diacylglycerol kinase family enzyme
MYYYIFDPTKLSQKSFERIQNQLYSCLSEYRIGGDISRVTGIRTVQQLVDIAFDRGVKTLVVIGTDDTLQEAISAVRDRDVTLGYVPVEDSELSRIFGLSGIDASCRTIAQRRVELLDMGVANKNWFFSRLSFGDLEQAGGGFLGMSILRRATLNTYEVRFLADGKYNAQIKAVAGLIINSRDKSCGDVRLADPTDGLLDMLLIPDIGRARLWKHRKDLESGCYENIYGCSTIHLKKIEIINPEGLPLKSAGKVIAKTPAVIEVVPKSLKMIVGKERMF